MNNREIIRESYIEVNDLALCAALLTMGIPFCNTPFAKIKSTHGQHFKFYLKDKSICDKYSTLSLINAWNDSEFHKINPEHPFAYIKTAFKNREGLLDKVNQSVEMILIERNGKLALISSNATKKFQDKIFQII